MATLPITGPWVSSVDLTGNSAYCFDPVANLIWLVGENTQATGAVTLFQSMWLGFGFAVVTTIPQSINGQVAFDPAVALDAQGNVHFIGQTILAGGKVAVQKYWWNASSSVLNGPFPITTGGLVGSDYDIVQLNNGNSYCCISVVNGTSETLTGFEIAQDGTIVKTDLLVNENYATGYRYGAVSLWTPDGVTVEVYCHLHPKVVQFNRPTTLTIQMLTRYGTDVWSSFATLTSLPATHTDNRLTVIGNGTVRYMSECIYSQSRGKLAGSILLGSLQGTGWNFTVVQGTTSKSLVEPVLSLSPDGLVLAYLTKDFTNLNYSDGPVSVVNVNPDSWLLAPRSDFPWIASATWLRGSRSLLDVSMPWGFLAQQQSGTATFYTGYNAPPVVIVSPNAISPAILGVTYQFDSSASFSYSLDPLSFTWTLDDPTGQATFTSQGSLAYLTVPKSVGPAAFTVQVTCAVIAWDPVGLNPLHSPTSQTVTVQYPAVAAPVIESEPNQNAQRNTEISFMPVITYGSTGALAHYWEQIGGTTVRLLSRATSVLLMFNTNGALVSGETLTFQLSVADNINQTQYQTFNFYVLPRIPTFLEPGVWTRQTFNGTLGQRNQQLGWGVPVSQNLNTNFTSSKRGALLGGGTVHLLISPGSVVVNGTYLYTVYLPDTTVKIIDAIHSDQDYTVCLTSTGLLQVFLPSAVGATDNATQTIDVGALDEGSFNTLQVTPSYGGSRVFTLGGPDGVLMLQVQVSSWTVIGVLKIDQESGLLYGSNSVTYVRTSNVESLRSGQVLVGTATPDGQPFETLISLTTRSIINTFDATDLRSAKVTTGERLFAPDDSYAGTPLAPVLVSVTVVGGQGQLVWTQTRADLVTGYSIYCAATYSGATLNTVYSVVATVSSGLTTTVAIPGLMAGTTYSFVVAVQSLDGESPFSNAVSVSL